MHTIGVISETSLSKMTMILIPLSKCTNDLQASLCRGIKCANTEMVKDSLEKGAEVSTTAIYDHWNYHGGLSALDVAVDMGLEKMVQVLLDHKSCNVNFKAQSGLTSLHIAAFKNNLTMAKKLISKGAMIDVYSPFQSIFNSKLYSRVTVKIYQDTKDLYGVTALQVAVTANSLDMVKLLVDYGANINSHCRNRKGDGYTSLHFAVMRSNIVMIDLLLSMGARVNVKMNTETTILYLAVYTRNKDIVKRLLDAGAHVDSRSNVDGFHGITPLLEAVRLNLKEIALMLVANGADVNATAKRKSTSTYVNVIDMTLENFDPDMLELVLNMGADIDNSEFHSYSIRSNKMLLKYAIQFRDNGLFVNEKLTKWADSKKKIKYDDFGNECRAQVERKDEEKIEDCYVRYCDLLFKNADQVVIYADNESIRKALELRNDENKLPLYTQILIRKFKKEYKRYRLLKEAAAHLKDITYLPYLCVRRILMYFSNYDLLVLLGRFVVRPPYPVSMNKKYMGNGWPSDQRSPRNIFSRYLSFFTSRSLARRRKFADYNYN
ncbi:putative ankyrin repeat protein RF_0381 [Microplitis mediator]|uniref:putative ankyrin repeat protein RF_0381 n=1 Tax=Microplitis mediator TaxID=375433 RepID=UPI00255463B7|nr:putative ankyrin repeat protein RF_0381 [Microplitis mediator]